MKKQIIETLKNTYKRDLRKQIVKSMLSHEKKNDTEALQSSQNIVNQILTYIISELNWTISQDTSSWDDTPLQILTEVFPKIETTHWFKEQQININRL